jgi:hypothetical protein
MLVAIPTMAPFHPGVSDDHRRPEVGCLTRDDRRHTWVSIEPDIEVRGIRGASWLDRGIRDCCPRCGAVWPVPGFHVRRLLGRERTPEDLEAERDEPRPGLIAVQRSPRPWDLRALTQAQTDQLIRFELAQMCRDSAEHEPIVQAIAGSAAELLLDIATPGAQVSWQRGGIDSDASVRVLARRAWGDRDRAWYERRGVREGDRVSTTPGASLLVRAWPGEASDGRALRDARPGELVWVALDDQPVREAKPHKVGDRRREPVVTPGDPDAAATATLDLAAGWGVDALNTRRDDSRTGYVWEARRDAARARMWIPDDALVTAYVVEEIIDSAMELLDADLTDAGAPRRKAERDAHSEVAASSTLSAAARTVGLRLVDAARIVSEELERGPHLGRDPAVLALIERWCPGTFPWK